MQRCPECGQTFNPLDQKTFLRPLSLKSRLVFGIMRGFAAISTSAAFGFVFWEYDTSAGVRVWEFQLPLVTYALIRGNPHGDIAEPICAVVAWLCILTLVFSQFVRHSTARFRLGVLSLVGMTLYAAWVNLFRSIHTLDLLFSIPFIIVALIMLFTLVYEKQRDVLLLTRV